MITEDYVSFETAKLLKEKGFDWDTYAYYEDEYNPNINFHVSKAINWNKTEFISKPTLQMTMKWLREVYNIDIETPAEVGILGTKVYVPMISTYKNRKDDPEKLTQLKFGIYYKDDKGGVSALKYYKTKEDACEAAIKYCLENLI